MKDLERKEELEVADEVWHRVVQIVQEGMLMGIDVADLLRQVRLTVSEDGALVLSASYRAQVKQQHEKLVQEAEELRKSTISVPGLPDGLRIKIIKDDEGESN